MNRVCIELHKFPELVYCPKCRAKIGKTYQEKLAEKVALVPQSKRQELLDYLHAGMTIGAAREKADIEFEVALEIIDRNIGSVQFLNRQAI